MLNLPNLITASNMLCGILAVLFSLSGRLDLAPWFIFAGAFLDFFDGFAARLLKIQSELGKQLDSLADVITFGVAPGMMMFSFLVTYRYTNYQVSAMTDIENYKGAMSSFLISMQDLNFDTYLPFIAFLIPVFSMLRLAKFNIDTRQSTSFIGLPTPANTVFFTGFPLILLYSDLTSFELGIMHFLMQPITLSIILLLFCYLLISEIPLFALKFKSFKWSDNQLRFSFLITCLIIIPIIKFWAIPIIIILYIILSVLENTFIKNKHEI